MDKILLKNNPLKYTNLRHVVQKSMEIKLSIQNFYLNIIDYSFYFFDHITTFDNFHTFIK